MLACVPNVRASSYHSVTSEDLLVAGRDQSAVDQPNNLAEAHPPL